MNDPRRRQEPHPAGVWRAARVALFAACFAWIPYAVPGLERLRVIGPGDAWPLADLLHATPRQGGAGIAGALREHRIVDRDDDDALLRLAPLPPPLEIVPRREAPPPLATPGARTPPPRIDPGDYHGLTREIEDPHDAMRWFYRRLGRVARGERVLARMSVYGTSINGGDLTTAQLRRLLSERFGDGGKGWVPIAPGWRYQRHQDVEWSSEGWRTYVVNRGDGPLGRYGYGGVVATADHPRAVSRIATRGGDGPGTRASVVRLFYQAWPEGSTLGVAVDDGPPLERSTRAAAVEDRVETIRVADGAHRFTIGPAGEAPHRLRLYGVTMERDGPGVVVDGLALIGAFTRVLRLFDEEHLRAQVRQRDPHLLVFWMGANDAVSSSVAYVPERYEAHYRGILRRFREAAPEASCLVMSVLDKGERVAGRIVTRARVPRLVEAQRAIAHAEGCAFFDSFMALGGEGTMARWYTSRPRLVTDDLGHLTASGARVVGSLVHRALLKGYDDWIAEGAP
ncbi:MAG: hypothetical protein KF729_10335 [Sandaracinaceae bacterium]|nr:hypothetical protein [Sandaracinaceae bacterium]